MSKFHALSIVSDQTGIIRVSRIFLLYRLIYMVLAPCNNYTSERPSTLFSSFSFSDITITSDCIESHVSTYLLFLSLSARFLWRYDHLPTSDIFPYFIFTRSLKKFPVKYIKKSNSSSLIESSCFACSLLYFS